MADNIDRDISLAKNDFDRGISLTENDIDRDISAFSIYSLKCILTEILSVAKNDINRDTLFSLKL